MLAGPLLKDEFTDRIDIARCRSTSVFCCGAVFFANVTEDASDSVSDRVFDSQSTALHRDPNGTLTGMKVGDARQDAREARAFGPSLDWFPSGFTNHRIELLDFRNTCLGNDLS